MRKSITIAALALFSFKMLVEGSSILPRRWASCGYVGGQIYCYGGITSVDDKTPSDTTLYSLDIAQFSGLSTELINTKWETVQPSTPFYTESRRAPNAIVLPDGEKLLIQGGYNYANVKYVNQTIIYDTKSKSWSVGSPYTEPNRGIRQIHFAATVNLPNNVVGFYGGFEQLANTAVNQTTASGAIMNYYTDQSSAVGFPGMQTYSPESKAWASVSSQTNLPVDFYPDSQTATFDPVSMKVYYLGGLYYTPTQDELLAPFDWALTFDTKSAAWQKEALSGKAIPTARMGHTAHLLPNSRDIVIYGGSNTKGSGKACIDYCYTLNLLDNSWTEQSGLNIPSAISGPRYSHSSVLVNNTLFVLFGKGLDATFQKALLAIDVTNVTAMTYIATFGAAADTAAQPGNNLQHEPQLPGLGKGAIGGIAAGAAVAVLLIVAAFLLCRRRQKKTEETSAQNNTEKQIVEEINIDWDKIDSQYREVSPINWNATNSPYSAHSMDATRVGGFSPEIESFSPEMTSNTAPHNVSVIKPSVDDAHRGYSLIKPDAK